MSERMCGSKVIDDKKKCYPLRTLNLLFCFVFFFLKKKNNKLNEVLL